MKKLKIILSIICLLAALVALVYQFKVSTVFPLVLVALFVAPIHWLYPSSFRTALVLPVGGLVLFLADAYAFRHRIAVEMRAWEPIWNDTKIVEKITSPSGKSTVYLLESNWLDLDYGVYISAGGLFPLRGYYEPTSGDVRRQDLIVKWSGPLFTFGHRQISYAYHETKHEAYNYIEWRSRAVMASDPVNSLEAFSAYVTAQQAKE